jgi:hypothetical protein
MPGSWARRLLLLRRRPDARLRIIHLVVSGDSPPGADRIHTRVLSISLSTSGMRRKRQEKLRRPGSQQEVSVRL